MFAKISLTAAFLLMVAPPMACASSRVATNPAPRICHAQETPGVVVAQDSDSNSDASDANSNDGDSNDNSDDNQNDNDQMNQDAAGNGQNAQQFGNDNDSNAQQQAPQNPQQMNPYQQ